MPDIDLTLRLDKGAPLTALEMDDNLTALKDGVEDLEALVSTSLNPDGTLKNASIIYASSTTGTHAYAITISPVPSALSDLVGKIIALLPDADSTGSGDTLAVNGLPATAITKSKTYAIDPHDIKSGSVVLLTYNGTSFELLSNPGVVPRDNYAQDTGGVNTLEVTYSGWELFPYAVVGTATGYSIRVKVANTNTGAATLKIGGLSPLPIYSDGSTPITAGMLKAGSIYDFVWNGIAFQILSTGSSSWTAWVDSTHVLSFYVAPTAGGIFSATHGFPGVPHAVRAVLVCVTTENGYAVGDEVDVHGVQDDTEDSEAFSVGADASIVWVSIMGNATMNLIPKSGGPYAILAPAKWRLKLYAQP